ncbi:MAG: sulfite exporter TauE/SafE family protein [Gammaproteobacteria bacterium]|nr:MAG: sulfite exporter TauE/SafE family protein [Gammaproteobacteria bacterium]
MLEWIVFALIGVMAGLFSGLLGLGGGLIIVPTLLAVFSWQALPESQLMHMAVGTSLMTITVTSLSSMYAHHQHKNINWDVVRRLSPGLIIGAILGAGLATLLSSTLLQQVFAIYVFVIAVRMWLPMLPSGDTYLLNKSILIVFSIIAGTFSALVGIGGGSLVVPYLVMAKQSIYRAIGSSVACGFPISVAAVIGFMIFGQNQDVSDKAWQTGFIQWKAFLGIISTSTLFSIWGAKLAKHLPVTILKRIFSLVLLCVVISLFV